LLFTFSNEFFIILKVSLSVPNKLISVFKKLGSCFILAVEKYNSDGNLVFLKLEKSLNVVYSKIVLFTSKPLLKLTFSKAAKSLKILLKK